MIYVRGTGCPLFHRDVGRGGVYSLKQFSKYKKRQVWLWHNSKIPKGVKIDNYTLPNNHKDIKDVKCLSTNNCVILKGVKYEL